MLLVLCLFYVTIYLHFFNKLILISSIKVFLFQNIPFPPKSIGMVYKQDPNSNITLVSGIYEEAKKLSLNYFHVVLSLFLYCPFLY